MESSPDRRARHGAPRNEVRSSSLLFFRFQIRLSDSPPPRLRSFRSQLHRLLSTLSAADLIANCVTYASFQFFGSAAPVASTGALTLCPPLPDLEIRSFVCTSLPLFYTLAFPQSSRRSLDCPACTLSPPSSSSWRSRPRRMGICPSGP